jgi:hypothetical protein
MHFGRKRLFIEKEEGKNINKRESRSCILLMNGRAREGMARLSRAWACVVWVCMRACTRASLKQKKEGKPR